HVRTRHRSCIRLFPSPRRHPHLFVLFSHPPSSPDIYTLSLHDALPICPETSPSIPSVKFTALEKPTNQKIANSVYNTNPKCNSCPNNAKDNGSFSCTKTNTKRRDRKSTRLNSSHVSISYAVFCLKKKNKSKIE